MNYPIFYGTQRFITAFTRAHHLSLSRVRWIQSIPPPHFFKSILILSSHLGLPSGLLTSDLPTKILYAPVLSPICATCHILHSSLFEHSNNIWWGVQIIKLLIMQFDHSLVNSSFLGPNILLNTLFSDTPSIRSSFNASDQVLHPNKKKKQKKKPPIKITVLCILMFIFLESNLEDRIYCTEWEHAFPDFSLLLIYSWIEFWFVMVVSKYLNS